jgi:obg-like ATPase 1
MSVDPVRDMGIIYEELLLKDLEYCQNRVDDLANKIKR